MDNLARDILARGLLIEETKKNILDEIKKYQVGYARDGNIMTTKTATWRGVIFVVPDFKYKELFEEG